MRKQQFCTWRNRGTKNTLIHVFKDSLKVRWEENQMTTPNDWIQEKMLPFYDPLEKGSQNMYLQIRREEHGLGKHKYKMFSPKPLLSTKPVHAPLPIKGLLSK